MVGSAIFFATVLGQSVGTESTATYNGGLGQSVEQEGLLQSRSILVDRQAPYPTEPNKVDKSITVKFENATMVGNVNKIYDVVNATMVAQRLDFQKFQVGESNCTEVEDYYHSFPMWCTFALLPMHEEQKPKSVSEIEAHEESLPEVLEDDDHLSGVELLEDDDNSSEVELLEDDNHLSEVSAWLPDDMQVYRHWPECAHGYERKYYWPRCHTGWQRRRWGNLDSRRRHDGCNNQYTPGYHRIANLHRDYNPCCKKCKTGYHSVYGTKKCEASGCHPCGQICGVQWWPSR